MNIALMSHDHKKELMVQFCIAYCGILAGHDLCATNTTGRAIAEATGEPGAAIELPDGRIAVRFVASWATDAADVKVLCDAIEAI